MLTFNLVQAALKDKAPALYQQLAAKGELDSYLNDLASQVSSETVDLTMQDRQRGQWDKLGPVECAARMKMASALNNERVMADLLEFPQDETSPPRPDETTSSALPT